MSVTSIDEIRLVNYRCFADHTVALRDVSLIIGANGCGKSALIEALRLVSLAVNRHRGLRFELAPVRGEGFPRRTYGLAPSLRASGLSLQNVLRDSSLNVAQVEARFSTGASVRVYVHPEAGLFATFSDERTDLVTDHVELNALRLPHVGVFVPPGELAGSEPLLSDDHVVACLDLPIGARHFRNQYRCLQEHHARFQQLLRATTPNLTLGEWPVPAASPADADEEDSDHYNLGRGTQLALRATYEAYECEASDLPSGLQVWLQTMWFLARMPSNSVVVLDEPETHLHPDLQHRLLKVVRGEAAQSVIATHSSELMADVEPRSLLLVDKSARGSSYADTLPQAQLFLDAVGTSLNLSLARLQTAPRFLLVEGPEDHKALSLAYEALFPDSPMPLHTVPHLPIGGLSGLSLAMENASAFRSHNSAQSVYCIVDGDYCLPDEVEEWMGQAKERGIRLHVWECKELENLFLGPVALHDFLGLHVSTNSMPAVEEIASSLFEITNAMQDETIDMISESLSKQKRFRTPRASNPMARRLLGAKWSTLDGRLAIVPGKKLLHKVASWTQADFGVSLSLPALIRSHRSFPVELRQMLAAVENDAPFPVDRVGVFSDSRDLLGE